MGQPKDIGGMGFRNLECFNLSLMAKQLWRIINHPDYLVASIIKEKYFRQGELLTVKAKTSSSMMWKRIISARKFIDSGARWRVGNGERPSKSGSTDGCRHQPLSKSGHQLVISMIMLLSKSCSNSVQPKEDKCRMRSSLVIHSGQRKLIPSSVYPSANLTVKIDLFGA